MKKITKTIIYAVAALALINLSACKKLSSYDYPPAHGTAYSLIGADNTFSIFRTAIDKAGLGDLINGSDNYTVFAPTNTALTNAGYTQAVILTMADADVAVLVKSHIVAGATDVNGISGSQQLTTLSGTKITVQKIGKLCYVNGGDILSPSLVTSNGFLNLSAVALNYNNTLADVINGLTSRTSTYTMLAAAITRASTGSTNFTSLLSGTTPYTFFAPNNAAFVDGGYANVAAVNAAAPDVLGNILKYQLVAGAKLTTAFDSVPVTAYNGTPIYFDKNARSIVPTSTVASNFTFFYANGISFGNNVPANMVAGNGVLHVVGRFFPAPITTNTLARITSDANLTMFAALIQRASTADPNYNFAAILADPLKSYTVFAVTNAGLQAAGYANIAAINAADPATLASILKFHMVPKRINNINYPDNATANTLYITPGTTSTPAVITFTLTGGFKVKGSSNATSFAVSPANIVTTNGMVDVIGGVLLP